MRDGGVKIESLLEMMVERMKDKPDDHPTSIGEWKGIDFTSIFRVDAGHWRDMLKDLKKDLSQKNSKKGKKA